MHNVEMQYKCEMNVEMQYKCEMYVALVVCN